MTRRWRRIATIASVLGVALVAQAIGNGDIRVSPEVTVVPITTLSGGGTGTATIQNTTSSTSYSLLVGQDATCDPSLTFSVGGGNPISIGPGSSRAVSIGCPSRGADAMKRCLYHATNNINGTALADFMGLCLYGTSPGTLIPQQASVDFGTVTVGDSSLQTLSFVNNGTGQISRVYLQTSDGQGNFQFAAPCNPDSAFCDDEVTAPAAPGGTFAVQVRCAPRTVGLHTAQLYVGTNTFQLLSSPVTLQCTGSASLAPALSADPTTIELPTPVEVIGDTANVIVHLANVGAGTLVINDVRTVEVDSGAAADWTYTASGGCTGLITTSCSLDAGELVDIHLKFDPSAIGRRRATLLVSYRDTVDRTQEIQLDGTGVGATLQLGTSSTTLPFGMVPLTRSSQLDFQLVNRGNRDTVATLALTVGSPPFALSPSSSATVAPTIAKTITATCAPTSSGQFTTTISATAGDTITSLPVTLQATCEASTLQVYSVPTSVQLGEVRIGTGLVRRTVQVVSTTGSLTFSGQPQLETSSDGVSVSALSSSTTPATFDITIDPQQEGLIATNIVVVAEGETLKIPLGARVVRADFEVAPKFDLGTFCVGSPTTSSNLSLASTGTATIHLLQPTLGQAPSTFQLAMISPPAYPSSLAAGASARVAITPKRQTTVMTLTDTLTWRTDVEGSDTATTDLRAQFLDSGGAIAPPALDFGKVVVHLYSETGQRVIIQNCNDTPLVLDRPIIKAPFSIDSPTFPPMLNPNETVTFSVGFHPTRIERVNETLRITSPQLTDGPLVVMLSGEGIAGGTPLDAGSSSDPLVHTSFYACSCSSNDPGGLCVILLALGCVLRPRRNRLTLGRRP